MPERGEVGLVLGLDGLWGEQGVSGERGDLDFRGASRAQRRGEETSERLLGKRDVTLA